MLTKYKEVGPRKGINKLLEKCFHVWGAFRNFFREGAPKFDIVQFFGRIVLKHTENEKGSRGIRGHAPPEKT